MIGLGSDKKSQYSLFLRAMVSLSREFSFRWIWCVGVFFTYLQIVFGFRIRNQEFQFSPPAKLYTRLTLEPCQKLWCGWNNSHFGFRAGVKKRIFHGEADLKGGEGRKGLIQCFRPDWLYNIRFSRLPLGEVIRKTKWNFLKEFSMTNPLTVCCCSVTICDSQNGRIAVKWRHKGHGKCFLRPLTMR